MTNDWPPRSLFEILSGYPSASIVRQSDQVLAEIRSATEAALTQSNPLVDREDIVRRSIHQLRLFSFAVRRGIDFDADWEKRAINMLADERLDQMEPSARPPDQTRRRGRPRLDPDGAMRALLNRPKTSQEHALKQTVVEYVDMFRTSHPESFPSDAAVVDFLIEIEILRTGISCNGEERRKLRNRMAKAISRARGKQRRRLIRLQNSL